VLDENLKKRFLILCGVLVGLFIVNILIFLNPAFQNAVMNDEDTFFLFELPFFITIIIFASIFTYGMIKYPRLKKTN